MLIYLFNFVGVPITQKRHDVAIVVGEPVAVAVKMALRFNISHFQRKSQPTQRYSEHGSPCDRTADWRLFPEGASVGSGSRIRLRTSPLHTSHR